MQSNLVCVGALSHESLMSDVSQVVTRGRYVEVGLSVKMNSNPNVTLTGGLTGILVILGAWH